jgi:hypothetical protein
MSRIDGIWHDIIIYIYLLIYKTDLLRIKRTGHRDRMLEAIHLKPIFVNVQKKNLVDLVRVGLKAKKSCKRGMQRKSVGRETSEHFTSYKI